MRLRSGQRPEAWPALPRPPPGRRDAAAPTEPAWISAARSQARHRGSRRHRLRRISSAPSGHIAADCRPRSAARPERSQARHRRYAPPCPAPRASVSLGHPDPDSTSAGASMGPGVGTGATSVGGQVRQAAVPTWVGFGCPAGEGRERPRRNCRSAVLRLPVRSSICTSGVPQGSGFSWHVVAKNKALLNSSGDSFCSSNSRGSALPASIAIRRIRGAASPRTAYLTAAGNAPRRKGEKSLDTRRSNNSASAPRPSILAQPRASKTRARIGRRRRREASRRRSATGLGVIPRQRRPAQSCLRTRPTAAYDEAANGPP